MKITEKEKKPELRNQTESQGEGFADVAPAKIRRENDPEQTEDSPDYEAIEERAYQLYEESDRQHGNADAHWHQAERELKRR